MGVITDETGKIVKASQRIDTVRDLLGKYKGAFREVLPKYMSPDRVLRAAMMSIVGTPKLLQCTQSSLIRCVMQAAQLGLEVGEHYGHAYLVPYKQVAKLILGYKGYVELGWRSERIIAIQNDAVFEGDLWDYEYGTNAFLKHKRRGENDPSKLIATWCLVETKLGGKMFRVVDRSEMEEVKARIAIKEDSPWVQHEASMWQKTSVRRTFKLAPMGEQAVLAVTLDEEAEAGLDQHFHPELPSVEASEHTDPPSAEVPT